MSKKLLFIIIIVVVLCAACSSPGESAAKKTVRRFVEGLYTQDADAIREAAPFYTEIDDDQKQQLYQNIRAYDSWNIEAVQVKGRSAVVIVEFSNPDENLQMQFPLEAQNNSWVIKEKISFSTTIDVIPAE
ncbi:MAG: hypothetical protein ACOC7X_06915 [Spirochaetota bacterium]